MPDYDIRSSLVRFDDLIAFHEIIHEREGQASNDQDTNEAQSMYRE